MNSMEKVLPEFFAADAVEVAQKILGCIIEYKNCSGIIVETEAYTDDPASHAYTITPRSRIMLETHGHVYVYRSYGIHHCLNFTTNKGTRGAVLIRAIQPLQGISQMQERRKKTETGDLMSGPGKLCQAFDITMELTGTKIGEQIQVFFGEKIPEKSITATPRIGISKAKELPWRFFISGNQFVSR